MAEKKKFTSSPSPMDLMAGASPTAFSSMSSAIIGGMPANMYTATNPYLPFLNAPDDTAKSIELQNLKRMLSSQAAPTGAKEANMFDYWQSLARATGFSKAKTPIGVIGPGDDTALATVIGLAAANNADPITYLQTLKNYGVGAKSGPKQPDTTTKYNKQVSTALQLKDITEARLEFNNAYFAAFGVSATKDLDEKFANQWNATVKAQTGSVTSDQTVSFAPIWDKKSKPVIDPKTKKQKIDKFGNPVYSKQVTNSEGEFQYKPITKTLTTTTGSFTPEEQEQFVADFLVKNFPNEKFNVENLGGAAKAIYDDLVATSTKNYATAPDFATLAPVIKDVLATTDQAAAQEKLRQYKVGVRNQVAAKYMGIAEYVNAGEDADKYVKPLIQSLSNALERDVTEADPLLKQALNFKGDDGKYRLPNDWEMTKLIMNDSGYGKTSTAINQAVDMTQNLRNKLGRA